MRYVILIISLAIALAHDVAALPKTLTGSVSNEGGRIGIIWNYGDKEIKKVLSGSPAELAGLMKGDKIIRVNFMKADFANLAKIRGEPYTWMTLDIVRNKKHFYFRVQRVPNSTLAGKDSTL